MRFVVAGDDFEAEVFDHLEIEFRGLAFRRQVVADEQRVGHVQAHRLQRAEVDLAAAGDAEFHRRVREPQQAEHLQAVTRVEFADSLKLRPFDRVQEVDRDRLDFHAAHFQRDVDQVGVLLAHAGDQAAAELHARLAHGPQRGQPVVERMRRANLLVEPAARVEIVVDAIDAGRFQRHRLLWREQTQATADVQTVLVFDFLDDVGNVFDLAIRRAATAGDDAVRPRLQARGSGGTFHQLSLIEHRVAVDLRFGVNVLRAITAVLRTEAALGVLQIVEVNLVPEVLQPNPKRSGDHRGDVVVWSRQD